LVSIWISYFPSSRWLIQDCFFYQDAVDKQPDEWRDDNLPPKQLKGESAALKLYTQVVGELLKHQRSHLRVLVSLWYLPTS
jgi:hypothetical protein